METIKSIIEWHEQTFPDATLEGQLEKFKEEEKEYSETPNLLELADMFIVACGIARFNSILSMKYFCKVRRKLNNRLWKRVGGDTLLQYAINEKMHINKKRQWNKIGQLYKHKED